MNSPKHTPEAHQQKKEKEKSDNDSDFSAAIGTAIDEVAGSRNALADKLLGQRSGSSSSSSSTSSSSSSSSSSDIGERIEIDHKVVAEIERDFIDGLRNANPKSIDKLKHYTTSYLRKIDYKSTENAMRVADDKAVDTSKYAHGKPDSLSDEEWLFFQFLHATLNRRRAESVYRDHYATLLARKQAADLKNITPSTTYDTLARLATIHYYKNLRPEIDRLRKAKINQLRIRIQISTNARRATGEILKAFPELGRIADSRRLDQGLADFVLVCCNLRTHDLKGEEDQIEAIVQDLAHVHEHHNSHFRRLLAADSLSAVIAARSYSGQKPHNLLWPAVDDKEAA